MNKSDNTIELAILGCGAIVENGYLPVLSRIPKLRVAALVDIDLQRARKFADIYKIPNVYRNWEDLDNDISCAIVALPHGLHAEVTIFLLERHLDVLVEKPLALTLEQCKWILEASEKSSGNVMVGMMRRFLHSSQIMKEMFSRNILGDLLKFDIREGNVFNWPFVSDAFFDKGLSGGGVLFDTGAHTLDSLLWWAGNYRSVEYYDDSKGGVEANALLELEMENGAQGRVELSRTRRLRNTAQFEFEKGLVEVSLHSNEITLVLNDKPLNIVGEVFDKNTKTSGGFDLRSLLFKQLDSWTNSILKGFDFIITPESVTKSISLIEDCYLYRKPLIYAWE